MRKLIHLSVMVLPIVLLLLVSCTSDSEPDPSGNQPDPDAGQTESDDLESPSDGSTSPSDGETRQISLIEVSKGRRVYIAHGCRQCHMLIDEGSETGPDLTLVGQRMTFDELSAWIPDPQAVNPEAGMPVQDIDLEDLEYLVIYLSTLK